MWPDVVGEGELQFGEVWIVAGALLSAGALSGFVAGLLGVGGGIVVVPVLYQLFSWLGVDEGVRMHMAVATSLAVMVPTSFVSLVSHDKKAAVDHKFLRSWAPSIVVGAVVGSVLARASDHAVLMALFASFALLLGANMLLGRPEWQLRLSEPEGLSKYSLATTLGGLSAMLGIGGGTFGVTAMTMYGYPVHRAVGTSAGFGVIISVMATAASFLMRPGDEGLPPYSVGYVNLLAFALIFPAAALIAPLGASIAHKLNRALLVRVFGVFLLLTGFRMFWDLLG